MNTRLHVMIGLALAVLLAGSMPASATEFRTGDYVSIGEGTTINDELYASGRNVAIDGTVNGELLAFGSQVSVRGSVTQSASLAGGNVDVAGRIAGNLRAAGGQVTMSGVVARNASLAGGTVTLARSAKVGRDLQAAGGTVVLEGTVGRNLNVAGGQVTLNGVVNGDVKADVGRLSVGPRAVIRGDLVYSAQKRANVADGARIFGRTDFRPQPAPKRPSAAWKFAYRLLTLLALYAVGAVFIALSPRGSVGAADRVFGLPWISLLIGFILLVVMPVAIMLVMITLIGIPLALILLAAYLVSLYVSRAFVGLAIGRWLFGRFGRPQTSPYLALLVGLAILWLLMAIPFIGGLVHFAALLLGLGAFAAQRYIMARDLRREDRM